MMGKFSSFLKRILRLDISTGDVHGNTLTNVSEKKISGEKGETSPIPEFDARGVWSRIDESIEVHDKKIFRRRRRNFIGQVAAVLLCALATGGIIYYINYSETEVPMKMEFVSTEKGEVRKVILPDSSVVWLNNQSLLAYPSSFGTENREVLLQGEAYFEVYRNEAHPFVVRSNALTTKVLGTKFNVRAYDVDNELTVAVSSGRVQVSNYSDNSALFSETLNRSDRIVYDKRAKAFTRDLLAEIDNSISWTEGKLSFHNVPLIDVTNALERRFNVVIKLDPSLYEKKIYADFERKSPDTILDVLSILIPAHLNKGRGYYEFIAE